MFENLQLVFGHYDYGLIGWLMSILLQILYGQILHVDNTFYNQSIANKKQNARI